MKQPSRTPDETNPNDTRRSKCLRVRPHEATVHTLDSVHRFATRGDDPIRGTTKAHLTTRVPVPSVTTSAPPFCPLHRDVGRSGPKNVVSCSKQQHLFSAHHPREKIPRHVKPRV